MKTKRAKAIKKLYLEMDEKSLQDNGFRMYNSLGMQIDWIYGQYLSVCNFSTEVPLSKSAWLSQDIEIV